MSTLHSICALMIWSNLSFVYPFHLQYQSLLQRSSTVLPTGKLGEKKTHPPSRPGSQQVGLMYQLSVCFLLRQGKVIL